MLALEEAQARFSQVTDPAALLNAVQALKARNIAQQQELASLEVGASTPTPPPFVLSLQQAGTRSGASR